VRHTLGMDDVKFDEEFLITHRGDILYSSLRLLSDALHVWGRCMKMHE